MEETKYIPIYFKDLFKQIFSDKNDLEPLKYLIKQLLDIEVNNLEFINNKIYRDEHMNFYVLTKTRDGLIHNIIFATNCKYVDLKESYLLLMQAIGEDYGKYDIYSNLRYYMINFNYGRLKELSPLSRIKLANTKNPEDSIELYEIIDIYLPFYEEKYLNKDKNKLTELESLLGIIGLSKQADIKENNKILQIITEKSKKYQSNEEIINSYITHKFDEDRIEDEVKISIRHCIENIIDKMKQRDISVEDIAEITGFSIEEVKKEKNERTII